MKKIYSIILIAIVAIIAISILTINSYEDYSKKINMIGERIFNKELIEKESFEIDKSLVLMEKFDQSLYFSSWSDAVIYRYNINNGEFIEQIGNKGEGPKENLLISGYEVNDSSYFTIDDRKYSLQHVSLEDSLIYFYKHPKRIIRAVKMKNKYLFLDWDSDYNIILDKFNLSDESIDRVSIDDAEVLETKYSGLVYDGFFINNDKYATYISYSNDKIICFNNNLDYIKSMDMIYEVPDSKWEVLADGNLYPSEDNLTPTKDAYLDRNNNLYILSKLTDLNDSDNRIIDVYNVDESKYLYSLNTNKIDGSYPEEILVSNNLLYALYPKSIVIFSIK